MALIVLVVMLVVMMGAIVEMAMARVDVLSQRLHLAVGHSIYSAHTTLVINQH